MSDTCRLCGGALNHHRRARLCDRCAERLANERDRALGVWPLPDPDPDDLAGGQQ